MISFEVTVAGGVGELVLAAAPVLWGPPEARMRLLVTDRAAAEAILARLIDSGVTDVALLQGGVEEVFATPHGSGA